VNYFEGDIYISVHPPRTTAVLGCENFFEKPAKDEGSVEA
jgi:hypothetical protein